jgi:hypothetical protein
MPRRPGSAAASPVLACVTLASVALGLAACGGPSSPTASSGAPPPSTAASTTATSGATSAATQDAVLVESLRTLRSETVRLSKILEHLMAANDAGGSVSAKTVSTAVYPVTSLLTTVSTELTSLMASFSTAERADAEALLSGVTEALRNMEGTSSLDAGGSLPGGVHLSGGAQSLVNSAVGGPLVGAYQSDVAQLNGVEQSAGQSVIAALEAKGSTSGSGG